MSVVATASIDIQTCPQDVPSIPAWFAEVTLVARYLTQCGILDALCDQVHLARGRGGFWCAIQHAHEALNAARTFCTLLWDAHGERKQKRYQLS